MAFAVIPLFLIMKRTAKAVTLIELIVVMMIISVFTFIAIPRLSMASVFKGKAQGTASQIASAIRFCRSLSIDNAATNKAGYALNMIGSSKYTGFRIINLQTSQIMKTETFPTGVSCIGANKFQFDTIGCPTGTLGNLTVSAGGKTFVISVVTATGMVKCVQQ
jgi:prepilin-type N-terminal cleavage/methylation domain-containing protein